MTLAMEWDVKYEIDQKLIANIDLCTSILSKLRIIVFLSFHHAFSTLKHTFENLGILREKKMT